MTPIKILVADDDADLRALLNFTLTQAGYTVCTASDGASALLAFERETPDMLVLDINMPKPNGLEVCRDIRRRSSVLIMILTVRSDEDDLVQALDCGADDFVRKPFSPRAFIARVRALARRAQAAEPRRLSAGALELDLEAHSLCIGSSGDVHLTPLELKIMQLLMTTPGRIVSADRMLQHVWGDSSARERAVLKQLMYRLRGKLANETVREGLIETVPSAGYRLNIF